MPNAEINDEPTQNRNLIYEYRGLQVHLARRELRFRDRLVPIGQRSFDIMDVLLRSQGALVTKSNLLGRIWPGEAVAENVLQVHVSAIRKALGVERDKLKTDFGRGYRLLGEWRVRQEDTPEPVQTSALLRSLRRESHSTNLPIAGSALVGRAVDTQRLRDLLSAYRVVTLSGPGGVGKTVQAIAVARSLFPRLLGDVWLVELASLLAPDLVASTVSRILDLQLGSDRISATAVARAIGERRILLVLDNCEHLIDAAADLSETIVRLCPQVSILATSREAMKIEGEYIYRLSPLDTPPPHQQAQTDIMPHSAVELFLDRTSDLRAALPPDESDLRAIAEICRKLDGIPLAIELAAARSASMGVSELASHLNDRFDLLTSGRRTALPRHRTLRATLDWSYHLLSEYERCLLRRLSVYPAGFDLLAAIAVMDDPGNSTPIVESGLASLVTKSLVTLDQSEGSTRWRMLETIRAYARLKLAASGEATHAARRSAEFFRDRMAIPGLGSTSSGGGAVLHDDGDLDNVRAALDWAFSAAGDPAIGISLTAAYAPLWLRLSLVVECRERAERALAHVQPGSEPDARILLQLHIALGAALVFTMGVISTTREVLNRALAIAEALNDTEAQYRTLWALWTLNFNTCECHAALSVAERFSVVSNRAGDQAAISVADRLMGNTLHYRGNHREAQRYIERVLNLYVPPKDERHAIWFHYDQRALARAMLARLAWLQGLTDQAKRHAQASLDDVQASGHEVSLLYTMSLAVFPVSLMTGDFASAEQAVTVMLDLAATRDAPFWLIFGRCLEGKLLIKRGQCVKGVAVLRAALEQSDQSGWSTSYPEFLGTLAEGLAGMGELAEGLATVETALQRALGGGEHWYLPELLRIKGDLLARQRPDHYESIAEACFQEALSLARQHRALFWELRAALSLALWLAGLGRPNAAHDIVAPVYDRFTEGFTTPDMRAARAMLAG